MIIVSGLPRSGTSLMMRILEHCGFTIVTDGEREPDTHNPHGYYEYEKVKTLSKDNTWLNELQDEVVKITSHQLKHLPDDLNYKIIYMTRNIDEIIMSQMKMNDTYPPEGLREHYIKHVADTIKNLKPEHLIVDYNELMKHPRLELFRIVNFLNLDTNIDSLLKVIDKNLWRNRS